MCHSERNEVKNLNGPIYMRYFLRQDDKNAYQINNAFKFTSLKPHL